MKSPVLQAMTSPLVKIEQLWRNEYEQQADEHALAKEQAELHRQAWREQYKRAYKNSDTPPQPPARNIQPPTRKRLLLTDATYEKLHEILAENRAGVFVIRDELTGWLADQDKPGRDGERAFYLQAWNGDGSFNVDRIGRG